MMFWRHALRRPSAGRLSRLFQEHCRLQRTVNPASRGRQRSPYRIASFSDQAPKAATKEDIVFITPRVKDLYERMIQLDKDEVGTVGHLVLEILELPIEDDEFYYHGIGGSGGGKGAGSAAAEAAAEPEKKSVVDLKLTGFDAKSKIKVIKEVRALANLGLKEAKELVEGAPKVLQKDLKPEAAEELKEKLEAVGATVEIV